MLYKLMTFTEIDYHDFCILKTNLRSIGHITLLRNISLQKKLRKGTCKIIPACG